MSDPNLLIGFGTSDDAAVYKLTADVAIVQSVDFFPPIVDDPYAYGAIAAANALSDLYAKGAKPLLALNIVAFPAKLPKSILADILAGGASKTTEAGVIIVGGHTIDDDEPKYGLSVTGTVKPGEQVANSTARAGDSLILTKPIGTGLITTAAKQGVCKDAVLKRAVDVMLRLNQDACREMLKVGVSACTDVTGFGFLGHLREMAAGSGVNVRVSLSQMPVIDGAWELAERGTVPGGTHRNIAFVEEHVHYHGRFPAHTNLLLCDPQTSGGLLISVAKSKAQRLLSALKQAGVTEASLVGEVTASGDGTIEVVP